MTEQDGERRWNPWRLAGWGGAAFLLVVPLIADAPWTPSDFVFMGVLMGSVGLAIELAFRKSGNAAYRLGIAVAAAAAFLLLWISGAVGIIGSEGEDANLLYAVVLGVALLGSIASLFRPAGMAWAMAAAALVQVLVPVTGFAFALAPAESLRAPEVPVLTGFFAGLWLLSSALLRKAAREEAVAGAAP